jgi:hypothetical protein
VKRPHYESASGLRPASAFLFVGVVLAVVCGRAWQISCDQDHKQPQGSQRVELLPAPDFDIADRQGRIFAQSVQSMDLVLSPRSMWQAHTPGLMAAVVTPYLDGRLAEQELLERFLPDAQGGTIEVQHKEWSLEYEQAERLDRWIRESQLDDYLWLERDTDRPRWQLSWRPADLLSEQVRKSAGREKWSPLRWTRWLADGVVQAVQPLSLEQRRELSWEQHEARRGRVWEALMPPMANTSPFPTSIAMPITIAG